MADDKQAEQPETETQAEPMPSSDKQTTSESTDVGQATEGTVPTQEDGLPDTAKDRTKREFDKLQQQLTDERTRREYAEGVYNSLYQQQQATAKSETSPIVDPDTGLIDEKALVNLQQRTVQAEQRAAEVEQSVKGYISSIEDKEAFAMHPELNPNSDTFDKQLHVQTRRILTDSMVNPQDYGGKQLTFKEAGNMAKGSSPKAVQTARKEGANEAVEKLTQKEQASLAASGSEANRRTANDNLEDLRNRTRHGDDGALLDRIKGLNKAS